MLSISALKAFAFEASDKIINSVQYPNLISISSVPCAPCIFASDGFISFISAFISSFNASYIPFNIMYNPIPPESTTLAFFKAGSKSGVLSSITFASVTTTSINLTMSFSSVSIAASAAALITDKIVPSVGLITAL